MKMKITQFLRQKFLVFSLILYFPMFLTSQNQAQVFNLDPKQILDSSPNQDLTVFVREGCGYCEKAKKYLAELKSKNPYLNLYIWDISSSPENQKLFQKVLTDHAVSHPAVPLFVIHNTVLVGFNENSTPFEIETLLKPNDPTSKIPSWVSLENLGLPLMTIVFGLIDGFNPCAMWVLVFLLSLLVHIPSKGRRFAIAGVFVFVSGFVYFAFMAAWIHVFKWIGWSQTLQYSIGILSLFLAFFHFKDAITEFKGVTLSLTSETKATLGAYVRKVIRAENLPLAFVAVTVLAVVVNFYELLCTAGLPAIYTQTLARQNLPTVEYYLYLVLYNIAYIFDDSIMVFASVWWLSQNRITSQQGSMMRWVSALFLTLMGLLMIFKPEWLVLS